MDRSTIRRFGDPGALCICAEEWCYCTELVASNGQACPACSSGRHIWSPGGARDALAVPAEPRRRRSFLWWLLGRG